MSNPDYTMLAFHIMKGELAYSDWGREVKARKRMLQQPGPGVLALVLELDPWHSDAFVGTPAEGQGYDGGRKTVAVGYDWCGNGIGVFDAPQYQIGAMYDVRGLGMRAALKLISIGAEMNIDGIWEWVLVFKPDAK